MSMSLNFLKFLLIHTLLSKFGVTMSTVSARRTLGVYFGSFDPIHENHVALILDAITNRDIDHLVLIVNDDNPYKPEMEKREQRAVMVRARVEALNKDFNNKNVVSVRDFSWKEMVRMANSVRSNNWNSRAWVNEKDIWGVRAGVVKKLMQNNGNDRNPFTESFQIVGEDSFLKSVKSASKDRAQLRNNKGNKLYFLKDRKVLVYPRTEGSERNGRRGPDGSSKLTADYKDNSQVVIAEGYRDPIKDLSSSRIRDELLSSGRIEGLHESVLQKINELGLYGVNKVNIKPQESVKMDVTVDNELVKQDIESEVKNVVEQAQLSQSRLINVQKPKPMILKNRSYMKKVVIPERTNFALSSDDYNTREEKFLTPLGEDIASRFFEKAGFSTSNFKFEENYKRFRSDSDKLSSTDPVFQQSLASDAGSKHYLQGGSGSQKSLNLLTDSSPAKALHLDEPRSQTVPQSTVVQRSKLNKTAPIFVPPTDFNIPIVYVPVPVPQTALTAAADHGNFLAKDFLNAQAALLAQHQQSSSRPRLPTESLQVTDSVTVAETQVTPTAAAASLSAASPTVSPTKAGLLNSALNAEHYNQAVHKHDKVNKSSNKSLADGDKRHVHINNAVKSSLIVASLTATEQRRRREQNMDSDAWMREYRDFILQNYVGDDLWPEEYYDSKWSGKSKSGGHEYTKEKKYWYKPRSSNFRSYKKEKDFIDFANTSRVEERWILDMGSGRGQDLYKWGEGLKTVLWNMRNSEKNYNLSSNSNKSGGSDRSTRSNRSTKSSTVDSDNSSWLNWNLNTKIVYRYIGFDVSDESVRRAKAIWKTYGDTLNKELRQEYNAEFHVEYFKGDFTQFDNTLKQIEVHVKKLNQDQSANRNFKGGVTNVTPSVSIIKDKFDIVSSQLALHYAFGTEKAARSFTGLVKAGLRSKTGLFVGTTVDRNELKKRFENNEMNQRLQGPQASSSSMEVTPAAGNCLSNPNVLKNKYFTITLPQGQNQIQKYFGDINSKTKDIDTQHSNRSRNPFGQKYDFFLENCIDGLNEFVVDTNVLHNLLSTSLTEEGVEKDQSGSDVFLEANMLDLAFQLENPGRNPVSRDVLTFLQCNSAFNNRNRTQVHQHSKSSSDKNFAADSWYYLVSNKEGFYAKSGIHDLKEVPTENLDVSSLYKAVIWSPEKFRI